jgi:hypothetical protein
LGALANATHHWYFTLVPLATTENVALNPAGTMASPGWVTTTGAPMTVRVATALRAEPTVLDTCKKGHRRGMPVHGRNGVP